LWFEQRAFWSEMLARSTGTVMRRKRLSATGLLAINIRLPPMAAQRRIVHLAESIAQVNNAADRVLVASQALRRCGDRAAAGGTTARLGEVVDVNPEVFTPDGSDAAMTYIDLSAVSAATGIDASRVQAIRHRDAPSRARRRVQPGDVLVATVRPNLRGFAVVPQSLDGAVVSTGFAVLRARKGEVDPAFLWAIVNSPSFVAHLVDRATGSGYPAVRAHDVASYVFTLPDLAHQQRVGSFVAQCAELGRAAAAVGETAERGRHVLVADLLAGNRRIPDSYDALLDTA
jgi:type I restriction enzyme S subunit